MSGSTYPWEKTKEVFVVQENKVFYKEPYSQKLDLKVAVTCMDIPYYHFN